MIWNKTRIPDKLHIDNARAEQKFPPLAGPASANRPVANGAAEPCCKSQGRRGPKHRPANPVRSPTRRVLPRTPRRRLGASARISRSLAARSATDGFPANSNLIRRQILPHFRNAPNGKRPIPVRLAHLSLLFHRTPVPMRRTGATIRPFTIMGFGVGLPISPIAESLAFTPLPSLYSPLLSVPYADPLPCPHPKCENVTAKPEVDLIGRVGTARRSTKLHDS
jgi:hypothetical protein